MASYDLSFKSSVVKDLAFLPKHTLSRILIRIEHLKDDPFPAQSRKLQGAERLYRLRVGDYRIVYEVDSLASKITREVYRHLN